MQDFFSRRLSKIKTRTHKDTPMESKPEKEKILLVDDNQLLLEEMTEIISQEFEVVGCTNPFKVMEILDETFRAVVLDVRMDGKNGFEVCEDINREFNLPVIFYTAFQNEQSFIDIINNYRPFGYLQKGGDPELLIKKIHLAVQ